MSTNILLIFYPHGQNILKKICSCSCAHVRLLMFIGLWTSILIVVVLGVMTFALAIITNNVHCQLLSNFQNTPIFSIFCLSTFTMSQCWWFQLLLLENCYSNWFYVFMLHLSSHLCPCLHLLFTLHRHGTCFCILLSLQLHHIHMPLVSTLHMHHCCFCITNFPVLLLPFFCMLFCFFVFWYVFQTIWLFDQLFCLICASFCLLLLLVLHISKLFGFVCLMCCASAIYLDFMLHLLF